MRLSKETEIILQSEKLKIRQIEGVNATYGYIVNQKIREIHPIYKEINWKKVKENKFECQIQENESTTDRPTALNLDNSALKYIQEMQIEFKDIFKAARIHKAFVIRLVMRASRMLENKEDIFINNTDLDRGDD